jgi:hypothetical protein
MSASSNPDELEPALVSLLASITDVPAQRDFIGSFLRAGGCPTVQSVANLHHIHDLVINQLFPDYIRNQPPQNPLFVASVQICLSLLIQRAQSARVSASSSPSPSASASFLDSSAASASLKRSSSERSFSEYISQDQTSDNIEKKQKMREDCKVKPFPATKLPLLDPRSPCFWRAAVTIAELLEPNHATSVHCPGCGKHVNVSQGYNFFTHLQNKCRTALFLAEAASDEVPAPPPEVVQRLMQLSSTTRNRLPSSWRVHLPASPAKPSAPIDSVDDASSQQQTLDAEYRMVSALSLNPQLLSGPQPLPSTAQSEGASSAVIKEALDFFPVGPATNQLT